jgi:hypothetical protein
MDVNRESGRFLLTGSANLLQLQRLADSLVGRIECLKQPRGPIKWSDLIDLGV